VKKNISKTSRKTINKSSNINKKQHYYKQPMTKKNLPIFSIILLLFSLSCLITIIFFLPPEKRFAFSLFNTQFTIPSSYILFFINFFLFFSALLKLITKSTQKSITFAITLTLFLILKTLNLLHWLNIALLTTLLLTALFL